MVKERLQPKDGPIDHEQRVDKDGQDMPEPWGWELES
jgi:hypothetical protein